MEQIRQPAVAGMFYPAEPEELRRTVMAMLGEADAIADAVPKAIIAPHAGYIYSGPTAARVYASLALARDRITRVVLVGPSHRVPLLGVATSSATRFVTPLGEIALDRAVIGQLESLPQVTRLDAAHQLEHSLEVHLPFLQQVLSHFSLVPLVVGDCTAEQVAEVLEQAWGGDETLVVISSDLSHYHDYATARRMDEQTRAAIERLDPDALRYDDACGRNPIAGLLLVARRKGLQVETLDLRNSGDTAGPRDRVVGYGAWSFR